MSSSEERAFATASEIARINSFFPVLPGLGNQWALRRPWEGLTVGLNLHLTTLSAILVRELQLGGGRYFVSAANAATTDLGVVDHLRSRGVEVFTGGDMQNPHDQLLDQNPDIIVDVGFNAIGRLLDKRPDQAKKLKGAIEITRSGITALRAAGPLPFPVLNVNDGQLKNAVENRHGVGEAIWSAVSSLTGVHLSGRRVLVIGYGPVGKGLAAYARAAGMSVEVVDTNPVQRLFAHYDGFPTPTLADALSRVKFVVTATGHASALSAEVLTIANNGVILINAGHGGDEIDIKGISVASDSVDNISEHVVSYQMMNGPKVTVLGGGHPLNIVTNSGSAEPVLLHFAVVGIALEHLISAKLKPGEHIVSDLIERTVAKEALSALSI